MATKLDPSVAARKTQTAPATATDQGADDTSVLHPDGTEQIDGRTLTIKEYRFVRGQRVRAKAVPFTHALQAQLEQGNGLLEDVLDLLATHEALVRELILDAIEGVDDPIDADGHTARADWALWIAGLNDDDGEALLLTWWGVCGPFFVRTVARRIRQTQQLQKDLLSLALKSAGATSTPASPPPVTATASSSAPDTPSGN